MTVKGIARYSQRATVYLIAPNDAVSIRMAVCTENSNPAVVVVKSAEDGARGRSRPPVFTENLIRVDDVVESPKLAE